MKLQLRCLQLRLWVSRSQVRGRAWLQRPPVAFVTLYPGLGQMHQNQVEVDLIQIKFGTGIDVRYLFLLFLNS